MTIELNENAEQHLLEVNSCGTRPRRYSHDFGPAAERLIKAGKIKILFEMHDFHGWEMGAMWEDIKFATKHCRDVEKIAMVGEKEWENWMATICKPFTMSKINYFDAGQQDEAREWLAAE